MGELLIGGVMFTYDLESRKYEENVLKEGEKKKCYAYEWGYMLLLNLTNEGCSLKNFCCLLGDDRHT